MARTIKKVTIEEVVMDDHEECAEIERLLAETIAADPDHSWVANPGDPDPKRRGDRVRIRRTQSNAHDGGTSPYGWARGNVAIVLTEANGEGDHEVLLFNEAGSGLTEDAMHWSWLDRLGSPPAQDFSDNDPPAPPRRRKINLDDHVADVLSGND